MKGKPCKFLESRRIADAPGLGPSPAGEMWGAFAIAFREGRVLNVISSGIATSQDPADRFAWEHVSVSLADRCPTWEEMSYIKSLFWRRDECVVEYHPPASVYVNRNPFVLHLWKPPVPIVLPPIECV